MSTCPLVVCIDVEPDRRQIDREPRPWTGFERLAEWVGTERRRLEQATDAPARFSWYFRLDAQVAETYGSMAWPLSHYARQVDTLRAAGDAFGVHVHPYRWLADRGSWLIDDGNQPWVEENVRRSLAAFADTLGSRCRLFRFGDHWLNDATVRCLEAEGVAVDLTLEPGVTAASGMGHEPRSGSDPDYSMVPRGPYRPSRADFRVPDSTRRDGLWMMPVTTGRLPLAVAWARRLRYGRALLRDASFDTMALNLNLSPVLFRAVAGPLVASRLDAPCGVLELRTQVGASPEAMARVESNLRFLTSRASARRLPFTTPAEALASATGA